MIQEEYPNWADEKIFQNARRINIGQYQSIVYGGYLPVVLGEKNLAGLEVTEDGTTYNKDVDPTMTNEFATAAYRFGHSMIQGLIQRFKTDNTGLYDEYHLHDNYFNSKPVTEVNNKQLGMEQILMGLVTQPAQTCDKEVYHELFIA